MTEVQKQALEKAPVDPAQANVHTEETVRYKDASLPIKERVEDLLGRMTLREKVGQLNQRLYGFAAYERTGDTITLTEETVREAEYFGGLGVVYGLYRADPWSAKTTENGLTPEYAARGYNLLQRCNMEHSRLGIPLLLSTECPHGHQALGGYLLPVNLAAGATFDPALYQDAVRVCARQLKEMGVNLSLVSALDVARDPRWGRTEECFGEDPYLCSRFAEAAVSGTQSEGVAMVAKHFCAQGETTGGVNASAARIGERELREIHLPAAKACCKAGVKGIMAAYNEIDGVYCHMNHHLLTEILRDEFGFDGIVMADGMALNRLKETVGDAPQAAALALTAGVDVSLWDGVFPRLDEAVEKGFLTESALDEAVRRVLTLKFEQGLFEHPYLPESESTDLPKNDSSKTTDPAEKANQFGPLTSLLQSHPQSLQLARESAVLLKNNGVLPLTDEKQTILLLGPSADEIYRMLGDYTPPVSETESVTLLKGLKMLAGNRQIKTCSYAPLTAKKKEEVKQLLAEADTVILALGGSSSRFGGAVFDDNGAAIVQDKADADVQNISVQANEQGAAANQTGISSDDADCIRKNKEAWAMECGEGMDCSTLRLPGDQMDWFELARQAKKPLVTILIAGRPYATPEIAEQTDALLYSFYPGPFGGVALAELLYGQESPSGRLPISVPAHVGQLPVYYNPKRSYEAMKYCDEKDRPLYEFGEGFGYGQLSYEKMALKKDTDNTNCTTDQKDGTDNTSITVTVTVSNISDQADWAVPQIYVRDIAASTVRRVRELKAFAKTKLVPGETKTLSMTLEPEAFMIWNLQMKQVIEHGEFEILLMDQGKVWDGQTIAL